MADKGDKVGVDPKIYKVVDGKLYLYYNGFWGNTLESWNNGNEEQLIQKGDKNWDNFVEK